MLAVDSAPLTFGTIWSTSIMSRVSTALAASPNCCWTPAAGMMYQSSLSSMWKLRQSIVEPALTGGNMPPS